MLSNCSVKKMYGQGFAYMLTFAFMHHPYTLFAYFLACNPYISLHFNVFYFLYNYISRVTFGILLQKSLENTAENAVFYNCVFVNFAPTRTDFQQVPGGETEYFPAYYMIISSGGQSYLLFSSQHLFFCALFSILVTIIPCRVRRLNNAKKDNSNGGKYDNESDASLFLCEHTNTNDAVGNHCAL